MDLERNSRQPILGPRPIRRLKESTPYRCSTNRALSAQEKRAQILSDIQRGIPFERAYRKAGLSDYGHNPAEYLLRLVRNGHVPLPAPSSA